MTRKAYIALTGCTYSHKVATLLCMHIRNCHSDVVTWRQRDDVVTVHVV